MDASSNVPRQFTGCEAACEFLNFWTLIVSGIPSTTNLVKHR